MGAAAEAAEEEHEKAMKAKFAAEKEAEEKAEEEAKAKAKQLAAQKAARAAEIKGNDELWVATCQTSTLTLSSKLKLPSLNTSSPRLRLERTLTPTHPTLTLMRNDHEFTCLAIKINSLNYYLSTTATYVF